MPGTNAGTGCPISFRCWKCRRNASYLPERLRYEYGNYTRVELTGRTRPYGPSSSMRMTRTNREYRCLDCGHVGWSRHMDLRKAKTGLPTQLVPDDVLIYYNGPCLFTCGPLLAVLIDDRNKILKYLVTEVTQPTIDDVKASRTTLRDAFLSGTMRYVEVDGNMTVLSIEATTPEQVNDNDLPREGVYLP